MITAFVSTVLVCVALAGAWTAARAFVQAIGRAYGRAYWRAMLTGLAIAAVAAWMA